MRHCKIGAFPSLRGAHRVSVTLGSEVSRHCEERSDEAIIQKWKKIASLLAFAAAQ